MPHAAMPDRRAAGTPDAHPVAASVAKIDRAVTLLSFRVRADLVVDNLRSDRRPRPHPLDPPPGILLLPVRTARYRAALR